MRIDTSVVTLSWIPSEAVTGMNKPVFESGVAHYDAPPPDVIEDLDELQATDRFRFANVCARGSKSKTAGSSVRATPTTAAG